MTRVSKDWCLSVRANQMIPVYPLTEDLQPGDVFLVQRSVADQASDYESKGFLPLDDYRHRIALGKMDGGKLTYPGITSVYFDGYFQDAFGLSAPHPRPDRNANSAGTTTQPFFTEIPAPRAVFPSYTFEVDRGTGASLAVPVHGIPVGLNFMQADKAIGSMLLLDAHTFAVDTYYLDAELRAWTQKPDVHQSLLAAVEANGKETVFLRVVSRVYLVGGVSVSLTRADSAGGNVKVGNVTGTVPTTQSDSAVDNYSKLLNGLSQQANGTTAGTATKGLASVGGSVQFTEASTLGVTLNQVFDHPLAIGYLGFDVAVLKDGSLGPRIPTFDVLTNKRIPKAVQVGDVSPAQTRNAIEHAAFQGLREDPNGAAKTLAVISRVSALLGGDFTKLGQDANGLANSTTRPADFSKQVKGLANRFENQWDLFVSMSGDSGSNYESFSAAFDKAFLGL